MIVSDTPIDIIPLFVRAGSIIPIGKTVESTNEIQQIDEIRVYPGADGNFELYQDDGKTYRYEFGESRISHLHWSDAQRNLTQTGSPVNEDGTSVIVRIVKPKAP